MLLIYSLQQKSNNILIYIIIYTKYLPQWWFSNGDWSLYIKAKSVLALIWYYIILKKYFFYKK